MKNILACSIVLVSMVLISCGESQEEKQTRFDSIQVEVMNNRPWDEADAELIIGAPAHFTETGASDNNYKFGFNTTWMADSLDSLGRQVNLYFMYQQFMEPDSAIQSYASIKAANAGHEGIETLTGIGDEAYFHTDNENFYFIMVRKGNRELRIKLNKLIPTATKENFLTAARRITDKM